MPVKLNEGKTEYAHSDFLLNPGKAAILIKYAI